MTSVLGDGVRLSLVLGHRLVDGSDDIVSDGSGEDGGYSERRRVSKIPKKVDFAMTDEGGEFQQTRPRGYGLEQPVQRVG